MQIGELGYEVVERKPEKQFDAVVCFDALHHIFQDVEGLIRVLETSFTNDEILVKKSKPVFVESTLTADVDGQIVEAAYRSKRVLVLVRL